MAVIKSGFFKNLGRPQTGQQETVTKMPEALGWLSGVTPLNKLPNQSSLCFPQVTQDSWGTRDIAVEGLFIVEPRQHSPVTVLRLWLFPLSA